MLTKRSCIVKTAWLASLLAPTKGRPTATLHAALILAFESIDADEPHHLADALGRIARATTGETSRSAMDMAHAVRQAAGERVSEDAADVAMSVARTQFIPARVEPLVTVHVPVVKGS
jgi:hypothetical protein